RIFLLTQFNSVSLHQHVQSTYRFDQFDRGFVRVLAAQQTPGREVWFQGTADAVRQSFKYFRDEVPDRVLVLSGDQLYRMDFQKVLRQHEDSGADVTIATKPVTRKEAGALGIMQVDQAGRITKFVEKPGDTADISDLKAPICPEERYLASMGIYVFNTQVLVDLLNNEKSDFGRDIIPFAIKESRVHSYVFDGYWKDIGTIRTFWEANLELTDVVPQFTFYDAYAPIYTHMRYLPPSKINCCDLNRCLLSEGCIISGHRILRSIVGIRAVVGDGSVVEHAVIMGADYYERGSPPEGTPRVGIGRDCFIKNAIIDKNARIGDGCYLTPEGKPEGTKTDYCRIVDGIMVIPKNAVIPAGTKL
ncbi:MAG: glucose-1-phosphate adenylyltransferase, partial [Kiritimatiellae bacterium]|nr:glucose-1-phosphate adenylyltransferase [Kiritimatiellia bacterium]